MLGQGVKVCPYTNIDELKEPHIHASAEVLAQRLQADQNARHSKSSPQQLLFRKTCGYFTALKSQGCSGPPHERTVYIGDDTQKHKEHLEDIQRRQRGHPSKAKCDGRLLFEYDHAGHAFIRLATSLLLIHI